MMESLNAEPAAPVNVDNESEQPHSTTASKFDINANASSSATNIPAATNSNAQPKLQSKEPTPNPLAVNQLSAGLLQVFEPPIEKAREQLKEVINKQNQIYIELSAEKFKLDSTEVAETQKMMDAVKVYTEKILRIKKQMHQIHQRSQVLKKRVQYIETCKQKELQRKLQTQQQEESLIGNK